ncbi:hypothetical protein GCM10009777_07530 [Microbacterium pumilum]|uniref:Uncharacterized protein n=1 Tax=Microbacterium pumilum TaxID=344165 RepID=A0ABN2RZB5_9MICO
MLLTLAMGVGSSGARAEQTDDGGALSRVSSVMDETTDAVTDTGAAATVAISHATSSVPPAPPAQVPIVAAVVDTVAPIVETVTSTVNDTVAPGVVAPIVAPVVEVVSAVPAVGDVVSETALDQALPAAAADVDETLRHLISTVTDTVGGVIPPLPSVLPSLPDVAAPTEMHPSTSTGSRATPTDSAGTVTAGTLTDSWSPAGWTVVRTLTAGMAAMTTLALSPEFELGSAEQPLPLGAALPADLLSMGSSGAGPGVWGMLALAFFVAYRAWVLRKTGENADAPAAPLLGTDVSPD